MLSQTRADLRVLGEHIDMQVVPPRESGTVVAAYRRPAELVFSLFTFLSIVAATLPGCARSMSAFDNKNLNEVVERVKRLGMKPGETIYLRLDSLATPASLHPRNPNTYMRGQEAGNVWASRAPTGEFTVIVVAEDRGHAGSRGFGYSEAPPQVTSGRYSLDEDAEHLLSCTDLQHKIDKNWWEVWSCEAD